MTDKKIEVKIEPINIKKIKVQIEGKTPLLMDRFPESVQEGILSKQTGVAQGNKKRVRDIQQEIKDAIHITSTGKIGFPATAFKKAMAECTSFVGDKFFSKKLVLGSVKIINCVDGLALISYKKQDVLKHNIGKNIKFSPQFHNWNCELEMQYDANNITATDIVTLLNYAGFYYGIGMWRPKCTDGGTGEFGMFEVKCK